MTCPCWSNTYALGHDGHCCFVGDDRSGGFQWRADEEICHSP